VLSPAEVAAHPHLLARNAFPVANHPTRGKVRVSNPPFKFSSGEIGPAGEAPYRAGEDGVKVLRELLGYPSDRIQELVRAGAVVPPR
jgi:crotonobetainyl-CoA:carnitine CoA-transferase CaiB-like acyl-CoA transferase